MSTFGEQFPALSEALSEALLESEANIGFGGEEGLDLLAVVLGDAARFAVERRLAANARKAGSVSSAQRAEEKAEQAYSALPPEVQW